MKTKKLYFLIFIFFLFTSCTEWFISDEITSVSKEFTNETEIDTIHLDGLFNVELYQSEEQKIVVEGTEEQINHTNIKFSDKTLFVKSPLGKEWLSNYEKTKLSIYVDTISWFKSIHPINLKTVDTLRSNNLRFYMFGEINTAEILVDTYYFYIRNALTGTGNYVIKGNCHTSVIVPGGSGHFNAKDLVTSYNRTVHFSTGDTYVNTKKRLRVTCYASGNVYYLGHPENMSVELKAEGRVYPFEEKE